MDLRSTVFTDMGMTVLALGAIFIFFGDFGKFMFQADWRSVRVPVITVFMKRIPLQIHNTLSGFIKKSLVAAYQTMLVGVIADDRFRLARIAHTIPRHICSTFPVLLA